MLINELEQRLSFVMPKIQNRDLELFIALDSFMQYLKTQEAIAQDTKNE